MRDPQQLLSEGFHEFLGGGSGDETAVCAFTHSLAARVSAPTGKAICFCGLDNEAQEHGQLYGNGLAGLGVPTEKVLVVTASGEKDLLWIVEEAVNSGAFSAVIGAFGASERLYGFAVSRRLKLRTARTKTLLFLIRHYSSQGTTAAHGRWRVHTLPSQTQNAHASRSFLGPPRLQLALERMNGLPPQQWEMEFDVACGFHLVPLLENRLAGKASGHRQTG